MENTSDSLSVKLKIVLIAVIKCGCLCCLKDSAFVFIGHERQAYIVARRPSEAG